RVGGGEGLVPAVGPEVVGDEEVVLGTGAGDGRPVTVTVEAELQLALAPHATVVRSPGDRGADVVPAPGHLVEDRVLGSVGERVAAAELGVEGGGVGRGLAQLVVDLVVDPDT